MSGGHGHDDHGGGHGGGGGGSNAMGDGIFSCYDEVGQAGKLMTGICSFVFGLSGGGGGGGHDHGHH